MKKKFKNEEKKATVSSDVLRRGKQTDGWMDGRMDRRMDRQTDGWIDGRTVGRMDRPTDRRTKPLLVKSRSSRPARYGEFAYWRKLFQGIPSILYIHVMYQLYIFNKSKFLTMAQASA